MKGSVDYLGGGPLRIYQMMNIVCKCTAAHAAVDSVSFWRPGQALGECRAVTANL